MEKVFRKVMENIAGNQRWFWAVLILILAGLINGGFFDLPEEEETCGAEGCFNLELEAVPNLSDEKPVHFVNDIFHAVPGRYYRLIFEGRADQDTQIKVKLSTVFDDEAFLKEVELKKGEHWWEEVVFQVGKKYTDLVFEKKSMGDGAEAVIDNCRMTELNIESQEEFHQLHPTIFAFRDRERLAIEQTDATSKQFRNLTDRKTLLGQIFQAETDYLATFQLEAKIAQLEENLNDKVSFQLRRAEFEGGGLVEIEDEILVQRKMSLGKLKQLIEENGEKVKIPLMANLKKGEYYFLGIDNEALDQPKESGLVLKGSSTSSAYQSGLAVVKTKSQVYPLGGDLAFAVWGDDFKEEAGQKILFGATIEDVGRGEFLYKYQSLKKPSALLDLEDYSEDVFFDEERKVLAGELEEGKNSFMTYRFVGLDDFSAFSFQAWQADPNWLPIRVEFSWEGKNWQPIDWQVGGELNLTENRSYDFQREGFQAKEIFLRFSPEATEGRTTGKYGLKDWVFIGRSDQNK